jgi:F-type H+-transporting ATPase subunit delta
VKVEQLPWVYAAAIYEKALEDWLDNLRVVDEALRDRPDLLVLLTDPGESFAARQRQLDPLIPPSASPEQRNFLYTLLKENRMEFLEGTLDALRHMAERGPMRKIARITSAISLTDEERAAIQERLRARFGPDLAFDFLVDPQILGGVVVRVGDVVIDDSLSARLATMRGKLAGS